MPVVISTRILITFDYSRRGVLSALRAPSGASGAARYHVHEQVPSCIVLTIIRLVLSQSPLGARHIKFNIIACSAL
ncbi:unnamed protein product [Arctia plantaginis]|uniref:Uncharacterized protein n=1 Tax=Arctia plantaginis TaxID=874455 RepID=A0A8S0ZSP5_ARCPL|nr:unnamed protein product [Arctia plantaginis]